MNERISNFLKAICLCFLRASAALLASIEEAQVSLPVQQPTKLAGQKSMHGVAHRSPFLVSLPPFLYLPVHLILPLYTLSAFLPPSFSRFSFLFFFSLFLPSSSTSFFTSSSLFLLLYLILFPSLRFFLLLLPLMLVTKLYHDRKPIAYNQAFFFS